jgi:benzoyl-CoA reductase/2-hydroxyglutaryl-CoA dehydratase subunit BcrC/BadD/HgdB
LAIRQCAQDCAAFRALQEVYDHRRQAVGRLGDRVVFKLGSDVPDELLIAGGLIPVQLASEDDQPLSEADRYLENVFDAASRRKFARIISGELKGGRLAIANSTDVLIRLYLYLRELTRVEPERGLPEIAFIDVLFTRNRLHQERNELIFRLFREQAAQWAGRAITDEEIRAAGTLCNENRALLRQVAAWRCEARIAGSEALVIIGSALFMERTRHSELVRAVLEDAAGWPAISGPRLFFTGSDQENTLLYGLVEDAGAVIVGEDHDWGNRFFDRDFRVDLPVERALTDLVMLREFSSKKSFVSQRVGALDRAVAAAGADGVVFYTLANEDASSWDYPAQKKMLDEKGIRSLHLPRMNWPAPANPDLAARLERFVAETAEGGAHHG